MSPHFSGCSPSLKYGWEQRLKALCPLPGQLGVILALHVPCISIVATVIPVCSLTVGTFDTDGVLGIILGTIQMHAALVINVAHSHAACVCISLALAVIAVQ